MINRRNFLKASFAFATTNYILGCSLDVNTYNKKNYFPLSVASGDPTKSSVILWTKIEDMEITNKDIKLLLEVSENSSFEQVIELNLDDIIAKPQNDYCVKVKLNNLKSYTTYYYRFIYEKNEIKYSSVIGRTKTAPKEDEDIDVKFAYISGQNYIDKYYNDLLKLSTENIDFVLHLGDYVYEQSPLSPKTTRIVKFEKPEECLIVGDMLAANSLSNYRDLYKTYKSDKALQKIHELFPMICMWDDHEFADDCWQDNATDFDGRRNEAEPLRKNNSIKAWFEYLPIDYEICKHSLFEIYPNNFKNINKFKIYRDFQFGKNVHIFMSDLRSYRGDHLVAEDAFPAEIVIDNENLKLMLGKNYEFYKQYFSPYINIDLDEFRELKVILIKIFDYMYKSKKYEGDSLFKAMSVIKGNLDSYYIFEILNHYNKSVKDNKIIIPNIINPKTNEYKNNKNIGFSYMLLGKMDLFSNGGIGSRYFLIDFMFNLYSQYLYQISNKESENMLGDIQEKWFRSSIENSKASWKIWGNEFMFTPLKIDLSKANLPKIYKQNFLLNADSWGGFPNKRLELLNFFKTIQNFVILSGDIHSFFIAKNESIPEFVTGSVSSETIKYEIEDSIKNIPDLSNSKGLKQVMDDFDNVIMNSNTNFIQSATTKVGYLIAHVTSKKFNVKYVMCDSEKAYKCYYNDISKLKFNEEHYYLLSNNSKIYKV